MVARGLSATEADAAIQEFSRERFAEIRKMGIKNVCMGATLVGVTSIPIYVIYASPVGQIVRLNSGRITGILACVGLYGLWKLTNGILYLVRPEAEDRSITDLSD